MSNAQAEFIEKIFDKFPDARTTRRVTRAQIMAVSSYIPTWLNAARVERGMYVLPGGAQPNIPQAQVQPQPSNDFSMIPAIDPNFVPFGVYDDLETIIKSDSFYPVYVYGPTGNGKSSMVEQICARNNKNLIRVNLNMMSDEDQLIGSKTLEDGNIKIVEGPVLIAMRRGYTLLLDEIDAGSANTLLCLQPILEGKPYYFKLANEVIHPAFGFNIIASANTKGKGSDDGRYIGTNILNEAFLERFAVTLDQQYPPAKVESKIISRLMEFYNCDNAEFKETLVKWADAIRRTFDDGGIDETITTRRLTHIIRAYSIFKDEAKAVRLCCNRFDVVTRDAFTDLYDKVSPKVVEPEPAPVKKQEPVSDPFEEALNTLKSAPNPPNWVSGGPTNSTNKFTTAATTVFSPSTQEVPF
jgi:hypothetical protein